MLLALKNTTQTLQVLMAVGLLVFTLSACQSSSSQQTAAEKAPAETPANSLTEAEKSNGWRLLFDGQSFANWRGVGQEKVPQGHWAVENGTLHKVASGEVPRAADGQPLEGGDLMTVEAFDDFELSFEWKTTRKGNSGLKYNVSKEVSMAHGSSHGAIGFEYQLLDDKGHPAADWAKKNTTAALYDLVHPQHPSEKNLKPVGEWNHSRIVVKGNHGEHWLNGQQQLTYELGTAAMDSLVQASKFKGIEGFAQKRKGHIVLQDHTTPAWFRNIKIRDL